jgi:putative hemolysin
VVNATPRSFIPRQATRYPAGWALGPVRTCARIVDPRGSDPRSVQPIASRYTNCAQRGISVLKVHTEKTEHYHVCVGFEYLKQNTRLMLTSIMVQNNTEKLKEIPICICRAQTLCNKMQSYKKAFRIFIYFIYSNATFLCMLLLFLCCPNHINVKAKLIFCIAPVLALYIII